jgi:peptide/nickel transport system permease protein
LEHTKQSVLQQLFKRPSAIVSLGIIAVACLAAVFAYLLAPDSTPSANSMVIELGARQPGFSKQMLLIPSGIAVEKKSDLVAWFAGKRSGYQAQPINGYAFRDDKLIVRHYVDEGMEDTLTYTLSQLLPASELGKPTAEQRVFIAAHNIKTRTFYLGTDRYGRDILSRLIVGSRVTLAVGLVAMLLSLTIGIVLGAVAGYFGGWVDNTVMWVVNILYAIPTLLLVFAITLAVGKGFREVFIAIGLSLWIGAARLIRGQVLALREMEYITAARALGISDMRIIFRHILPNIAGPVLVIAASNFAAAMLIEAGLSFLGFGVQPPHPSWGLMIKENYNFLIAGRPLLALIPGIAIMMLVYAFNILGNAFRDILDVKS